MPVYAYKCNRCQYAMKMFHGIDEKPGKCPSCNEDTLQKSFINSAGLKITVADNLDNPGKRVEKYIEEARQSIKEQIAEARKDYIP